MSRRWTSIATAVLVAIITSSSARAENARFSVTPNKCVALRKGQPCYQKTTLTWQASQPGHYCIYASLAPDALHCWSSAREGSLVFNLESASDVRFVLATKSSREVAHAEVVIAWVYSNASRRSRSWRLF